MKKYTKNTIANYIIQNSNRICEDGIYYLYIIRETGELSVEESDDTELFAVEIDMSRVSQEDFEKIENADFMYVCDMFANDINRFMESQDEKQ